MLKTIKKITSLGVALGSMLIMTSCGKAPEHNILTEAEKAEGEEA